MEINDLKKKLISIQNNDFQLTNSIDISELTDAMLNNIGSADPILRDKLIYTTFSSMIINGFYTKEQLKHYLDICLDNNHLFYNLGEVNGDSVFTRSFSSLIIAAILYVNRQERFLSSKDLAGISDSILYYLKQEQDVRGLVNEKGWAHSIAHISDAMDELVKQPQLSSSLLKDIFSSIVNKMCFNKDYFLFEEDERMVIPVMALLEKGLDEAVVCDRIKLIADDLKRNFSQDELPLFIN